MFRYRAFLILIGILLGCNPNQQKSELITTNDLYTTQDSVITDHPTKNDGSTNYPYLTIRFKQHDTEVEMTIDPLETNLQLDLKRTPDTTVEIEPVTEEQDSVEEESNKAENVFSDILDEELKQDNLTDEILADLNTAQSHFYRGEYTEALQVLQESIKKKPTASAYALGGSIYYVNGDLDKAIEAWEIALQINPQMTEIKNILAQVK